MSGRIFTIGILALIAFPANAQYLILRTEDGAIASKACAKTSVSIRASITTDTPLATVQAYPIESRRIIGQLNHGECRYVSNSEAQYTHSGGYTWVNLVDTGWVPGEFLEIFQESVDTN